MTSDLCNDVTFAVGTIAYAKWTIGPFGEKHTLRQLSIVYSLRVQQNER